MALVATSSLQGSREIDEELGRPGMQSVVLGLVGEYWRRCRLSGLGPRFPYFLDANCQLCWVSDHGVSYWSLRRGRAAYRHQHQEGSPISGEIASYDSQASSCEETFPADIAASDPRGAFSLASSSQAFPELGRYCCGLRLHGCGRFRARKRLPCYAVPTKPTRRT